MRYKNAVVVLIVCALIVLCFRGCLEDEHIRERTVEFVEVHETELLELYAMYEAVELSGSGDYSEIRAFEEAHFDEDPPLYIRYYGIPEKMVIWFDNSRDGRDWGVVYCANPDFDIAAQAHTEIYEKIRDGFYTYIYYYGF